MESEQNIEEQVKRALAYLIAEGLVVEEEGLYRMKTEEEIQQELQAIINS